MVGRSDRGRNTVTVDGNTVGPIEEDWTMVRTLDEGPDHGRNTGPWTGISRTNDPVSGGTADFSASPRGLAFAHELHFFLRLLG
jgi:hypothetical protein